MTAATMSPVKMYDNFPMRTAAVKEPNYSSAAKIPVYKGGGEVARPKSVVNGRKIRNNYENMNTQTHPDFYPIYGPQGRKRRQTPVERERPPQENTKKPQNEKPQKQAKEEPRQYYRNEPETREKYKSQPVRKEKETPRDREKPVRQDNKSGPEIIDPYQSNVKKKPAKPKENDRPVQRQEQYREESPVYKNKETPEKNNKRKEPVVIEPYQSQIKKKPVEPKKQKTVEKRREESPVYKEQETPQRNNARTEPVIIEPYQSQIKKKPQEPKKQKIVEIKQEESPVYKEHETPQKNNARIEPVIVEPYQSEIKKKPQEPKTIKQKEERRQEEQPIFKEQETYQRNNVRAEPVIIEPYQSNIKKKASEPEKVKQKAPEEQKEEQIIHKEAEKPQQKSGQVEPYIIKLYQSKLRKRIDEKEKNKKTEEQMKKEPVYEVQKDEEQPESKRDRNEPVITKLYQSKQKKKRAELVKEQKQDKENIPNEENFMEDKDEETPTSRDKHDPVIRDLYRSKLKAKPQNIKEKNPPKPEPKKEPVKIIVHKVEEPKPTPQEPKEEPKKEPEKKPVEEKKHDPYAIIYEAVKEEPPKKVIEPKPDPYTYKPPVEKKEEPLKVQTPEPVKEIAKTEERKPAEKKKPTPKIKEVPVIEEPVKEKNVTPQRARFRGRDTSSVRAKYYEQADMDTVLRDKIATQLRENGISETKVVPLSAKITQAVKDDVIDNNSQATTEVTENLKEAINKHLDPVLYNKVNTTDLKDYKKPSDARHLSNLVLLRVGQVHEEVDLCKKISDEGKKRAGRGHSAKDDSQKRSKIMAIKDSLKKQKTENEVLRDKVQKAEKETHEVAGDKEKNQEVLQSLDSDNWQLQRELNESDIDKRKLVSKLKKQMKDNVRLERQHRGLCHENNRLTDLMNENETRGQTISAELLRLQSENARLKVLADQKEKEILHLRDPDQEMISQLKILTGEVTLLRTQTRRQNEEKGLLKSKSQKVESCLEESYKQKDKITVERENLERENEELKHRYRTLALANPQQKTLPGIHSGRHGPSSRANSRSTSRAYSRNVPQDDRRLSIAREADEDDNFEKRN